MRLRRTLLLLAIPVAAGLGSLALVIQRAHRTLRQTTAAVRSERDIAFTFAPLSSVHPVSFQPIASPADFTAAAFFHNQLFIAGHGGLFAYTADGTLRRTWRAGLDLPAAPLGTLAVATLRGASAPQLLIVTAGEGILIVSGDDTLQQLRPTAPEDRDITAMLPLPTGELLLGTRGHGVLTWSGAATPGALTLFHPTLDNLHVTAFAAGRDGFWIGTRDAGVVHWSAGAAQRFSIADGLPDAQILSLTASGDSVFAGTPVGVEQFTSGHPVRTLAHDLFASALLADRDTLTIATLDQGLRTLALTSSPAPKRGAPHLTSSPATERGAPHLDSEMWAGEDAVRTFLTAPDGTPYAIRATTLKRREPNGSWTNLIQPQPSTLTDADISALAFDADGRLWAGTFDRGIDILNLTADATPTQHIEDGHVFCINRLALDPARQTMAAATANGLVLFDRAGHPRQVLTRRDGLIADHITDIAFHANSLILATPAGLTFLNPGSAPESLYAFQGLVNNHVYAIAPQPDESSNETTLLAGTLGGLSLLQHQAVTRNLTVANSGLKHNWITALASDNHNGWTAGTYGAGIMQIAPDATIHALTPPFIVNPNAMLRTPTHLLAGTLDQGLWIETLGTAHWTHLTAGLPSLNVTAFAERNGTLYIGTENGLVSIPERELPQ